jgi:hypothetical protein
VREDNYVVVYPIPVMFLGVVHGWSAVISLNHHTVLSPCLSPVFIQSVHFSLSPCCNHGEVSKVPNNLDRKHCHLLFWVQLVTLNGFLCSECSVVYQILVIFLTAFMLPLGVAQKPRYHTDSDSGVCRYTSSPL